MPPLWCFQCTSSVPEDYRVLASGHTTVVYFDDILVTGDTAAESFQNLGQVLERLDKAGTRLKKEKCTFGAEEVVFLCHRINRFRIKPLDEKVEALVQAKPPENVQQLKAYLRLLNYYGHFRRDLSEELHPCTNCCKRESGRSMV